MDEDTTHSIDGRPVYQDCIPLVWKTVESRPDPTEIILVHNSNEEILKAIYALDDTHADSEEPHDFAQQLARMDAKINFLMGMVGQLLSTSLIIPDRHAISLSSTGMQWKDKQLPDVNAYLHVELYLKINYPKPIILPAVVNSVDKTSEFDGEFNITVSFEKLTASVEECLEKLIFRHHRRLIALTRR